MPSQIKQTPWQYFSVLYFKTRTLIHALAQDLKQRLSFHFFLSLSLLLLQTPVESPSYCRDFLRNSSQSCPLPSIAAATTLVEVILLSHLYYYNAPYLVFLFSVFFPLSFLHYISLGIFYYVNDWWYPSPQTSKHTTNNRGFLFPLR